MKRNLLAAMVVAGAFIQAGCNGCNNDKKTHEAATAPPAADKTAEKAADPVDKPPPKAAAQAEPAVVEYRGPRSESADGYKIATGFANSADQPIRQLEAMEKTSVYITVMDKDNSPVGQLGTLAGQQMHAFLVATDMRQGYYSAAAKAVEPGADGRKVEFKPREGGDHALIVAFRTEDGAPRTISSPVVIRGALPSVAGPGIASLPSRSRTVGGEVQLIAQPSRPKVGQTVTFGTTWLDNTGQPTGKPPAQFLVVYNATLGEGVLIAPRDGQTLTWKPTEPGVYLVLTAPIDDSRALTWKIHVDPAEPIPPASEQPPASDQAPATDDPVPAKEETK